MQIIHKTHPAISEDTDGKECLLGLTDAAETVTLAGFGSSTNDARNLLLADGEFEVPLSSITLIRGFWVKANAGFDLRINGGATIQVRPGKADSTTEAPSARVLMEASITSLHITPLADLRIHWAAWGDDL